MSQCFCVMNVNCSGSGSICFSSSDLLGVRTKFSLSYHWHMRLKIHGKCLPESYWWKSFLFSCVLRKFPQLSKRQWFCRLDNWGKTVIHECVRNLQCDTEPLPLGFVGISVPTRLLWPKHKETPMSWLKVCRKCCYFCGIVQIDFHPFNVVEHRHEYDSFIKKFWSLPVPVFSEKCFSIALLKLPSLIFR